MLNKTTRFISRDLANYLYRYTKEATGYLETGLVPMSKANYSTPVFESLLEILKSKVEKISGKKLFPTYSYYRVYTVGQELVPHKDRPSCEISVSICLGGNLKNDWPLYIGKDCVSMKPGEGVVYKGCDVMHWRHPLKEEGKHLSQLFLHYIDIDGPYYPEYKFDKRDSLRGWDRLPEHDADNSEKNILYPGGNF